MLMRNFSLFLFLILCFSSDALCQHSFWILPDKGLLIGSCNLSKFTVIDTARMEVAYEYYTDGADSLSYEIALLQVGENYTKFYGRNRLHADSVFTAIYGDHSISADMRSKAQPKYLLPYEIIRDRTQHKLRNIHRLAFRHDRVQQYFEPVPRLDWKILDQRRVIAGYPCYCAETCFGGRLWRAWFTPEIPVDAGPWKLTGLPGLILEAMDSTGDYRLKFRSLTTASEPVVQYLYNTATVDKKRWMRYEKRLYENPRAVLREITTSEFYTCDENGQMSLLDETWTIPYNPIELE